MYLFFWKQTKGCEYSENLSGVPQVWTFESKKLTKVKIKNLKNTKIQTK